MATDHLATLTADAAALAAAARKAGLDAPVPTCPEWKVENLVRHVVTVHQWAEATVRTRATERVRHRDLPPPPEGEAAIDALEAGADRLVATFAATDPDEAVWNWTQAPNVAGWWRRRQALETAVHRFDGQAAAASVEPLDGDLAIAGFDELLTLFLPIALAQDADLGGTLHLHATDRDGEYQVAITGGKVDVKQEHGKGDAALRGTASDLYLWAWNRIATGERSLELFGDTAVVDRWRELVRF